MKFLRLGTPVLDDRSSLNTEVKRLKIQISVASAKRLNYFNQTIWRKELNITADTS